MNGVLPVYREIKARGQPCVLVANGKAVELLPEQSEAFRWYPSTEALLKDIPRPRALVTCMSSLGGIGRDLVPLVADDCPSFALQDYWGGQLQTTWVDPQHRPSYLVVNDAVGAALVRRAWPDFGDARISILGYPALDRFQQMDVTAARARARAALGIAPDQCVVLYAGQLAQTATALGELVAALNECAELFCLLARKHPRLANDAPVGEQERWDAALAQFTCDRGALEAGAMSSEDALAAADLVVGMYSTVLVEAAVLRIPSISVLSPDVGAAELRRASGGLMDEAPLVVLGASAKAATHDELVALLRAACDGSLAARLRPAQERAFTVDGRNASRVADFVIEHAPRY